MLYITERCVFKLNPKGLELIEVAPGISIEKDILPHMEFTPIIEDVKVFFRFLFYSNVFLRLWTQGFLVTD